MTAGRGIVHSERTPEELRGAPMSVSGLQTWLALPDGKEEVAPVFENTAASVCPKSTPKASAAASSSARFPDCARRSRTDSDTLYADLRLAPGASVQIPADAEERAIYTLEGEVSISGDRFPAERLLVFRPGDEIVVVVGRPVPISCCSAAPRSARRATSGGTSSRHRRNASNRPSRNGRQVASISFLATRKSSFRYRTINVTTTRVTDTHLHSPGGGLFRP